MARRIVAGLVWATVLGFLLLLAAYCVLLPADTGAVDAFLSFRATSSVAEEELMDPLIASRGDVVPKVLAAITSIPMPMRRYALAFLGNQGDSRSLPLLRSMLENPHEQDLLRGDALLSIAMIDQSEGRRLAAESWRGDYLRFTAQQISRGHLLERRERWRAMVNVAVARLNL